MRVKKRAVLTMCGAVLAGVAGAGSTAVSAAAADPEQATTVAAEDAAGDPWVYSDKWGVIGRNTIGSPVAELRFGPWGRTTAAPAATQKPPYGHGSLGLLVAAGPNPAVTTDDEKIAYGNETDFAGVRLRDIKTLSYSIFTAMDSIAQVALPGIAFEIDPKLNPGVTYSTLGYLPNISQSPSAPATPTQGRWQTYDAAATGSRWFATGATGPAINCTLASPCTFAQAKAALPNAVITYSVEFQKGRDNAFTGAVDGLRINDDLYDFEFKGVRKRRI
ncbi:hypothetical protein EDD29_2214 [Actinocorallia herbida]|uniref:Uncharacterized protein n=1 Tax=Actinocorallia herbida TaxID=58109 RepID=A0A3N1CTP9_9ACTN|nr:hypothetical protein [Actinocorallia herbida]ROO84687.1 hypothetical protein EDD29_2214 [Actinocorallia herbida]